MKTLLKKLCPECNKEFEYEAWNKSRIYCSRKCKDIHMSGSRYTTAGWVKKAKEKHNNFYSYEKTDINNRIDGKIYITCKYHGLFLQNPTQHLLGKGCKKCAHEKQFLTTEEFIKKANLKHKEKYTYALTQYKSMKEHVIITCSTHGNFLQTPIQHIYHGAGCHICAQIYTISKGENEWLNSCLVPDRKENRQVQIKFENRVFVVDGLIEKTVYEYLGDFWHGNPKLFSKSEINILAKKSFGDLHLETMQRFDILKNLGYNVKYIWESEWHQTRKL